MSTRFPLIIAGNWKQHHGPQQARTFISDWMSLSYQGSNQILLFPPALCAQALADALASALGSQQATHLEWGLQNSWTQKSGAFTGENSLAVAKEMGARWSLIGHSERRSLFGETDSLIKQKVEFALSESIRPIICIGETLQEREAGKTFEVLGRQISGALQDIKAEAFQNHPLVIAYEPVWAIGTGVVAKPEQVKEAHAWIHTFLNQLGQPNHQILYGGSVKADNAQELAAIPFVNGFLVGGASLEAKQFFQIAKAGD